MSDSSTTNNQTSTTNQYSIAPGANIMKDSLTNTFNITNLVTLYSHALQNAYLTQIPGDTSNWFPIYQANLQTAQKNAKVWTDTLGPLISSTIPQSIVTYNDTFNVVSGDILNIANSCLKNVEISQDQITELTTYFSVLSPVIKNITDNVDDALNQFNTFSDKINNDYTNLVKSQTSAQHELEIDEEDINTINKDINNLQSDIQSLKSKATESELGIIGGIIFTIVCVGLAFVTAGATAVVAGVAAGVSLAGTGTATGFAATYNKDISNDQAQISSDQQKLNDDQKQVTALQSITNSIQGLLDYNNDIKDALTKVKTEWETLQEKMNVVSDKISKAVNDKKDITEDKNNLAKLIGDFVNEKVDIQGAQTAWSDLSAYANVILDSYANTQVQIVDTNGNPIAAK